MLIKFIIIIELRFIANQNSSSPLLGANGDQGEEEEGESYEVEVITNHPKESSMNWQGSGETDDSDEVNQYNVNI